MLYELSRFVIPRNVLPTHIKIMIQQEVELGFYLIRKKLIVVVKKSEVVALRLATSKVTSMTTARTTSGMNDS